MTTRCSFDAHPERDIYWATADCGSIYKFFQKKINSLFFRLDYRSLLCGIWTIAERADIGDLRRCAELSGLVSHVGNRGEVQGSVNLGPNLFIL